MRWTLTIDRKAWTERNLNCFKGNTVDGKKDPKMMLDWTQGQSVPMQVGCSLKDCWFYSLIGLQEPQWDQTISNSNCHTPQNSRDSSDAFFQDLTGHTVIWGG